MRLTPPPWVTVRAFRELLRRLPDRLRWKLGDFEFFRCLHWTLKGGVLRPHAHFVVRTSATASELRAALHAVLPALWAQAGAGHTNPPNAYYAAAIEDVTAVVRYVAEDTADDHEPAPADDDGDQATTSRGFLNGSDEPPRRPRRPRLSKKEQERIDADCAAHEAAEAKRIAAAEAHRAAQGWRPLPPWWRYHPAAHRPDPFTDFPDPGSPFPTHSAAQAHAAWEREVFSRPPPAWAALPTAPHPQETAP
jgi:hypothetical protein